MANVLTPYATGTITSVSGTTVNLSGGAVAGWVGRCIAIADGPAMGQIRKITAVVSATQITVDYAWSISPFWWLTEADPVNGNTFTISHDPVDIVDGTTVIQDGGTRSFRFVGASTFSGGAFLYAANCRIEMNSSSIAAGSPTTDATRCRFRFGDIDQFGNVYNGCYFIDHATAPSGFGTGSATTRDPDFHFYGGTIRLTATGSAGPFWRLHSDDNEITRMVGCDIDGNMGGRVTITAKTVLTRWMIYNMRANNGTFNPKKPAVGPNGVIFDIRVANSLQAIYHFWTDSRSVKVEGIKLLGGVDRIVRFANTTISGETLTVVDVDISAVQAMPALYNNANGTYTNLLRLAQYLDASYRNAAGAAVVESTRFVVRDNVPTAVYDSTVTDGVLPRQELRYRDMTVLNTGTFTWASAGGTTFAPYQIAACSYNNQPSTANLPLLTSQDVTLLALPDANISQTNRAIVDAYTTIDTLDQLYDRAKAWTVDNLAAANPSFGAQLAHGNGTELNFGAFNIIIDAGAPGAFSVSGNTITIKSGVLIAGDRFKTFRTTGTLSFTNNASVSVSYTTGAGSFAVISVSGFVAGSRIQLLNATDNIELYNEIVAGTSYSAVFPWPGERTVRLRVSRSGYMDFEQSATFLATGASFVAAQTVDAIFVANNVDGSNVPELTADFPNIEVDINDPDGLLSIKRIYAWYHYICESSADGIRNFFGAIIAEDEFNLKVITARVNLRLRNAGATPVKVIDGRIYRDDGSTIIAGGAIEMDPGKAYTANTDLLVQLLSELHLLQGLTPGAPMTVTPTSRVAGPITLQISGDGTTSTTVTRT